MLFLTCADSVASPSQNGTIYREESRNRLCGTALVQAIINQNGFKLHHCLQNFCCLAGQGKQAVPHYRNFCLTEPAYCAEWWSDPGEGLSSLGLPSLAYYSSGMYVQITMPVGFKEKFLLKVVSRNNTILCSKQLHTKGRSCKENEFVREDLLPTKHTFILNFCSFTKSKFFLSFVCPTPPQKKM